MLKIVTEKDFDASIKEGVVLVDFYADWCGPCKMLAPVLEELAEEYGSKATIIKVNVDEDVALAGKYQVQSIPSLKLFKDGKLVDEALGFLPKPKLEEMLNKTI